MTNEQRKCNIHRDTYELTIPIKHNLELLLMRLALIRMLQCKFSLVDVI